jgi:hypothetical protein
MNTSDAGESGTLSGKSSDQYEVSNAELLNEIKHLAKILEKTPSIKEMDESGKYSGTTYRDRFGTWNEAVLAAGLELNTGNTELSDATLIENMRDFALALDRTPTQKAMIEEGPHAPSTYVNHFGTWNEAVRKAGLEPNTQGSKPSDQDLIDELERVTMNLGKIPAQREFKQESEMSISAYHNHFGTWKAAIETSGLKKEYDSASGFHISTEDLIAELKRLESTLDQAPTISKMDEFGAYSERTYRRRFGSWSNALERAGIADQQKQDNTRITEQELIAALQALSDKLGRSPCFEDMIEDGRYGAATYLYRFGSWNQALIVAGLQPRPDQTDQIPDRDLIIELRRLSGELGHLPKRKEMENMGRYSGATYYDRYGSWRESLSKAGFSEDSDTKEAHLTARCFACARTVDRPLIKLSNSQPLFCDEECASTWTGQKCIQFEKVNNILIEDNGKPTNAFFEAFDTETLIAEILVCLHLAVAIFPTSVGSAVNGNHRIENRENAITITRLNAEQNNKLLVSHETADQFHEAISNRSDLPATPELSPVEARADSVE